MIYLDTAALIKVVRREQESDDLIDWLNARGDRLLVSSALTEIELVRALRRAEPALLSRVPGLLARIAIHEIDPVVRATAAAYTDPMLRSLDAIHLATAHAGIGDQLTAFVTYD